MIDNTPYRVTELAPELFYCRRIRRCRLFCDTSPVEQNGIDADLGLCSPWHQWTGRLDEWVAAACAPGNHAADLVDFQFPTRDLLVEYLDTIEDRSESDIFRLLRQLLVPSGRLGIDHQRLASLAAALRTDQGLAQRQLRFESTRRLIRHSADATAPPPWEGITWIVDLLPSWPHDALTSLAAYQLAHAQQLPDGRYSGLSDAMAVIRAKWIGIVGSRPVQKLAMLQALPPRDFEHLVEALYVGMGYRTKLTTRGRDGGLDIEAEVDNGPARREKIIIECKRYSNAVGVETVRTFHGVVYQRHMNKGVLVTTSRYTRGAKAEAAPYPRLVLVSGTELVDLCDEYLGPLWDLRIDGIINASKIRMKA